MKFYMTMMLVLATVLGVVYVLSETEDTPAARPSSADQGIRLSP